MPGIQNLSDGQLYMMVALALAGAVFAFWSVWRNFVRARIIEDTPTARLRSAPQGYVELVGEARALPGRMLVAPLTGLPCVWYRYCIEREVEHSRHGRGWREVESGASEMPFLFGDGTGECLIEPKKAEVTATVRKTWYGNRRHPVAGDVGGGDSLGIRIGLGGLSLGRRYRYREWRLEPGYLYVLGWLETTRGTDGTLSTEVSRRMREWKQEPAVMLERFDRDGDGHIDAGEWTLARGVAEREMLAERARRSAEPATARIRSGGPGGAPFMLAGRPQQALARRYRLRAAGSLAGFALAVAVVIYLVALH